MARKFCVIPAIAIVAIGLFAAFDNLPASAPKSKRSKKPGKYIGAEKCKKCHKSKKYGEQHAKWKKMKHARAFKVLASPEAKKLAKEIGIGNPQKSPKCLKCHVTAYGVSKKLLGRGFKQEDGVQCESCHGPGDRHFKARFLAASEEGDDDDDDDEDEDREWKPLPKGEIIVIPPTKTCLKCHNEESPSFKGFCLKKRYLEVAHLDPRKKRTKAELEAMKCPCGKNCKCKKCECGGFEKTKKKK